MTRFQCQLSSVVVHFTLLYLLKIPLPPAPHPHLALHYFLKILFLFMIFVVWVSSYAKDQNEQNGSLNVRSVRH